MLIYWKTYLPVTEQCVGSSEDYKKRKANSCVIANIYITGRMSIPWRSLRTLGKSTASKHNQVIQNSDSAFLHEYISFSAKHWEVKKPCQLHSWNGNTNSCYQCAGDTTEWIIYFPNGYPHVINNEKVCINSPMGQMNNNCLWRCWTVIE